MKNMKPNNLKQYAHPAKKALVVSLSAVMTAMVCSSTLFDVCT